MLGLGLGTRRPAGPRRRMHRGQQPNCQQQSERAQANPQTRVRPSHGRGHLLRQRGNKPTARGQQRDKIAGDGLDRARWPRFARQGGDQPGEALNRRRQRHPRQGYRLLPGVEVQSRERGYDAERLSMPILADRGEEERIEIASDAGREGRVGHVVNQFHLRFGRSEAIGDRGRRRDG